MYKCINVQAYRTLLAYFQYEGLKSRTVRKILLMGIAGKINILILQKYLLFYTLSHFYIFTSSFTRNVQPWRLHSKLNNNWAILLIWQW